MYLKALLCGEHQVLDKIAGCSGAHLPGIVESIEYVISKVPDVFQGDHWGDLVVSYLSLHTWLNGKTTNFEDFEVCSLAFPLSSLLPSW
jgi:hypothetical protein